MKRRKWLILTALSMESRAIAGEICSTPANDDVALQVIGIGARRFGPGGLNRFDVIILAGLAGGLDPTLGIGDVVCDSPDEDSWHNLAMRYGRIHTSDHLIATVAEKQGLFRATGCLAVDMEGSLVRSVVQAAGVPLLHIRAISDLASQSVSKRAIHWIDQVGKARPGRIATDLITNPLLIAPMIRLGRQSHVAVRRMAEAVCQIVQNSEPF